MNIVYDNPDHPVKITVLVTVEFNDDHASRIIYRTHYDNVICVYEYDSGNCFIPGIAIYQQDKTRTFLEKVFNSIFFIYYDIKVIEGSSTNA